MSTEFYFRFWRNNHNFLLFSVNKMDSKQARRKRKNGRNFSAIQDGASAYLGEKL